MQHVNYLERQLSSRQCFVLSKSVKSKEAKYVIVKALQDNMSKSTFTESFGNRTLVG